MNLAELTQRAKRLSAELLEVPIEHLSNRSHIPRYSAARQLAMFLVWKQTDDAGNRYEIYDIARIFKRDYHTARSAIISIQDRIETNARFRDAVRRLLAAIAEERTK